METELSLIGLVDWLWARKRFWISVSLTLGAVFWIVSWTLAPVYQSSVVILPKFSSSGPGSLNQLASLAGLSMGAPQNPEALYSDIIRSDTLLNRLIALPGTDDGTLGDSLIDPLGMDEENQQMREYQLKEKLRKDVLKFATDDGSGVMSVSAKIPSSPELAAVVANSCVRLLDEHIQSAREQHGKVRTEFMQARLQDIELELGHARAAVTKFVAQNRSYASSPELAQRHSELMLEQQAVLEVWIKFREQLELEEVEAHGELQALDILDWAIESVEPIGPNRAMFLALGIVLGFVISVTVLSFRDARKT